jgi:hypothetical protein
MLDPTRRFTLPELPGVLVFPDDHLETGFYAIPEVPRVAVDDGGTPQISLMLYGRKKGTELEVTGGLLALTTTLRLTPAEEETLRRAMPQKLAELHPPAPDAPPPVPQRLSPEWLEAEVKVQLIPGLELQGKPSMTGTNVCSFQSKLTADQAKDLQKAWKDGLRDAKTSYRLAVRAAPRAGSTYEMTSQLSSQVSSFDGILREASSLGVHSTTTQSAPLPLTLAGPLRAEGLQDRMSTVGF